MSHIFSFSRIGLWVVLTTGVWRVDARWRILTRLSSLVMSLCRLCLSGWLGSKAAGMRLCLARLTWAVFSRYRSVQFGLRYADPDRSRRSRLSKITRVRGWGCQWPIRNLTRHRSGDSLNCLRVMDRSRDDHPLVSKITLLSLRRYLTWVLRESLRTRDIRPQLYLVIRLKSLSHLRSMTGSERRPILVQSVDKPSSSDPLPRITSNLTHNNVWRMSGSLRLSSSEVKRC